MKCTGGETAHGSLGNLLSTVLRSPGLWHSLAEDSSCIPSVVREGLCWGLSDLELVDHETALPRRTVLRCPDALRVRR